jgi:hypothetical protein
MLTALHDAIAAVCPIVGVSIGRRDDRSTWRIDYAPNATAEQRAAAQATLEAFDLLGPAKQAAIDAIDARSASLIAAGLQVDSGAPVSLSLAAQTNLLNIAVAMQMGALTLPQDISRLDGRAYTITDAADAARIARLAGSRIKAVLDAGRELRARVLASATQSEIESVTDNRS